MIENGASGYLIKSASSSEIEEAIKTVLEGKIYLNVSMEHLLRPQSVMADDSLPKLTKREKKN